MQVIQKSSSGTQSFPLDAMLLAQRTVFLTGEINTSTVNAIIQQLLFLESADATAPIKLIITSPGGRCPVPAGRSVLAWWSKWILPFSGWRMHCRIPRPKRKQSAVHGS